MKYPAYSRGEERENKRAGRGWADENGQTRAAGGKEE